MEKRNLSEAPLYRHGIPLKVTEMGNITELKYISNANTECPILMLEGGEYMVKETAEIKECKHHEKRTEQVISLKRTFRNLRNIINANCSEPWKVRFITLTYAENMQDTERLYKDFHDFNLRFQYHLKKNGYDKAEYIAVAEPQARGAWHMHVLYIWNCPAPFIPNSELADIWGNGFVNVRSLDSCDNVGAYLTAYLADIEVSDCPLSCAG